MKPFALCLLLAGSALLRASPLPVEFSHSDQLEYLPPPRAVISETGEGVLVTSAGECCRQSIQSDERREIVEIAEAPEPSTGVIGFAGLLGLAVYVAAELFGSQRRMPKS